MMKSLFMKENIANTAFFSHSSIFILSIFILSISILFINFIF